jgi:hypothetical protein
LCGNAIIDYEHFDPEFRDARTHDPRGILLLCVGCHNRKTRGRISKETIEFARANPKAKSQGFSFDVLDVASRPPTVIIGNTIIKNTPDIVQIEDDIILRAAPPEEPGAPFRIGASLNDRYGRHSLLIIENEWRTSTSNWDVECIGRRTTIRSQVRSIEIRFQINPPDTLIFEHISLLHRGVRVEADLEGPTRFTLSDGSVVETPAFFVENCQGGIIVRNGSVSIGYKGGSVRGLGPEDMAQHIAHLPDERAPDTKVVSLFPKRDRSK